MAKSLKDLDELIKLVGDEDVDTLRLIEREVHSLVERKEREIERRQRDGADRTLLSEQCSNVSIDPDLLALVGIHPENPVEADKTLIRDEIARRFSD